MNLQYQIEHGSYYLYDMDRPPNLITKSRDVKLMTDVVAIGFDRSKGVLHKHGRPEDVEKWARNIQDALRSTGLDQLANDIVVMSGKFPIDELNKCLKNGSYCKTLYESVIKEASNQ